MVFESKMTIMFNIMVFIFDNSAEKRNMDAKINRETGLFPKNIVMGGHHVPKRNDARSNVQQ